MGILYTVSATFCESNYFNKTGGNKNNNKNSNNNLKPCVYFCIYIHVHIHVYANFTTHLTTDVQWELEGVNRVMPLSSPALNYSHVISSIF